MAAELTNAQLFDRLKMLRQFYAQLKAMGIDFGKIEEISKTITDFLSGIGLDLSKVTGIIDAFLAIFKGEDTKAKILAAVNFLEVLAAATSNTTDDQIAKVARWLADNVLDWVLDWIEGRAGASALAVDNAVIEAQGFDIGTIFTLIGFLKELLD